MLKPVLNLMKIANNNVLLSLTYSPWTYYILLFFELVIPHNLEFLSHSSLIVNWLGLTCTFLSFQFLTVFCFLFWLPDLPETLLSPNIELVFSLYYEPDFSLLYLVPSAFLLKSGLTNLSAVTVAVTVKTTTTRCFVSQSMSMVSSATTTTMC